MISLSSDHLWSSIAGTTTSRLEGGIRLVHVTQTKINDLKRQIVVEQKIFGLEISVTDPTLMDVLYTRDQLEIKFACLFF